MHLPVMLKVKDALCLVIGGGRVAERKVSALLDAGARVRIISPAATDGLERLAWAGGLELFRRPFRVGDLDEPGILLVVAATDQPEVNRLVCVGAKERGLLVNAPAEADGGNVDLPAVVRRGKLVLSVYTSGASPGLSARIKRRLEQQFPPEYAKVVDLLAEMRLYLKENVEEPEQRRQMLEQLLDVDWLEQMRNGTWMSMRQKLMTAWQLPLANRPENVEGATDGAYDHRRFKEKPTGNDADETCH